MLVGFHTTEFDVADSVVNKNIRIDGNRDEKEWLGKGVYVWPDSVEMALAWVRIGVANKWLKSPAIIKYDIDPGLCLDVNNEKNYAELREAYNYLKDAHSKLNSDMPVNERILNGVPINRFLDCFVIETVDFLRRVKKLPRYDTVKGMFEDGQPVFPGAAVKDKTHIQMAVRNHNCLSKPTIVWPI